MPGDKVDSESIIGCSEWTDAVMNRWLTGGYRLENIEESDGLRFLRDPLPRPHMSTVK
jgi:hypothetical protein